MARPLALMRSVSQRRLWLVSLLITGLLAIAVALQAPAWAQGQSGGTLPEHAVDLSVEKTDDEDPIGPGDTLTYTITATNHGPADATNVSIIDRLPPHALLVSAEPESGTCTDVKRTVTCDTEDLAPGETVNVELLVIAPTSRTMVNHVRVESDQRDLNRSNNKAKEKTTVSDPDGDEEERLRDLIRRLMRVLRHLLGLLGEDSLEGSADSPAEG